jgi:hypothetical protein
MVTTNTISTSEKNSLMHGFFNYIQDEVSLSKQLVDLNMKNPLIESVGILIKDPISYFAKQKNEHSEMYKSLVRQFVAYFLRTNQVPKGILYFDDSTKADSTMIYINLSEDTFDNRDKVIEQVCHLESEILEDNLELNCLFITPKVAKKLQDKGLESVEYR